MDRLGLLAALVLLGVAAVGVGAAVRLVDALATPAVVATTALVVVVLLAVVLVTVRSVAPSSTPYW